MSVTKILVQKRQINVVSIEEKTTSVKIHLYHAGQVSIVLMSLSDYKEAFSHFSKFSLPGFHATPDTAVCDFCIDMAFLHLTVEKPILRFSGKKKQHFFHL